jgi:hypothetical protein
MNPLLALILALGVAAGIPIGYVFYESAFSAAAWQYAGGGHWVETAPGPIAGAGLPVILIAVGAYWVIRKLRQNAKQKAM